MAHAGAESTYHRNRPYWGSGDLITLCPADSVVGGAISPVVWGRASHHNTHAIERFIYFLRHLYLQDYENYIIHEYDSLCLAPTVPPVVSGWDLLWGNVFGDDTPLFAGKMFIHPPLALSSKSLRLILEEHDRFPAVVERGFWDRWLGFIAPKAGVKVNPYGPLGFSCNTIEPSQIPAAVEAVLGGAVMIHGVKTQQCFDALVRAYEKVHKL